MKRRDFWKSIGLGSAALAPFPSSSHALAARSEEHDGGRRRKRAGFRFVSVSQAKPVGEVVPRILMNGCGTFRTSGESKSCKVEGGGSYDLINFASPVPSTILAAGTWEAERVLSFNPIGTYGVLTAGILELDVDLLQEIPEREEFSATLRIACSLAPAGLDTGEPEGFVLTIPGSPFGPFRPIVVAPKVTLGLTVFTRGEEED
jgi:hypothetical protein